MVPLGPVLGCANVHLGPVLECANVHLGPVLECANVHLGPVLECANVHLVGPVLIRPYSPFFIFSISSSCFNFGPKNS